MHGCQKVQTSEWSELAGVPVALLGLVEVRGDRGVAAFRREAGGLVAAALSLVGFGFSAYLTYREIWTIDAICIWCVASAIVLTLLAVVTTVRLLRVPDEAFTASRRPAAPVAPPQPS